MSPLTRKRILALDIGSKRIGLAISDPLGIIAQPYKTILFKNKSDLLQQLKNIIEQEKVNTLVIGIPYTLKGAVSQKTQEVIEIKDYLKENLEINIVTEDERLTTVQAEQSLREMGKSPSRSRDKIDQLAAVHILRLYMSRG